MSDQPSGGRIAVLRDGSRDGEQTTVAHDVRRLLAASAAPGLVEVYTATGEYVEVRGNEEAGEIFAWSGQEVAADMAPEMLHLPST